MKLQDLLRKHDEFRASSELERSWGDGALCARNPLYGKVRAAYRAAGGRFVDRDPGFQLVMPYLGLDDILANKRIFVVDNVSVLREIERRRPGRFQWQDLPRPRANHVLHESAHVLAEAALGRAWEGGERIRVARLLLAESLANTVDAWANLANADADLRAFHDLNSYAEMNKKTHAAFLRAREAFGGPACFRALLLAYVQANALAEGLAGAELRHVLELVFTDEGPRRRAGSDASFRRLIDYAFELSMTFRVQTTGFYGALHGLGTGDVYRLLDFDVLGEVTGHAGFWPFLAQVESALDGAL